MARDGGQGTGDKSEALVRDGGGQRYLRDSPAAAWEGEDYGGIRVVDGKLQGKREERVFDVAAKLRPLKLDRKGGLEGFWSTE